VLAALRLDAGRRSQGTVILINTFPRVTGLTA